MHISSSTYEKACNKMQVDLCDDALSHLEIEGAIDEFLDAYDYVLSSDEQYGEAEIVSILYAWVFALESLSISTEENDLYPTAFLVAIQCLLASISNAVVSVCLLLKRGLYHSTTAIIRNMLELCFILLNLLLDERKRTEYISNNELILKRGKWRKQFSFKALNATLREYENTVANGGLAYMSDFRNKSYAWYSSSAHNGYAHIVCGTFIPDSDDDFDPILKINIGGIPNKRLILSRLMELNDFLFYTEKVLQKLINFGDGIIKTREIVDNDKIEVWRKSQLLSCFAEGLLLAIKFELEESV